MCTGAHTTRMPEPRSDSGFPELPDTEWPSEPCVARLRFDASCVHTGAVRLFVAVDLPVPVVHLVGMLPRPVREGLRWTTPWQWHVTLQFLGDVDDPDAVADALSGTPSRWHAGAVEAQLGPRTVWFRGGRVLYIPVTGLEALADTVHDATSRWGPHEGPAFAGHLTLARFRGVDSGPADIAGTPIAARFEVPDVVLYASSLGPEGATYRALSHVPIMRDGRT